jgi:hypothetical protein
MPVAGWNQAPFSLGDLVDYRYLCPAVTVVIDAWQRWMNHDLLKTVVHFMIPHFCEMIVNNPGDYSEVSQRSFALLGMTAAA